MFRKISLFFVIAFVPFFLQAQEDDLIWQKNVNTDFLESAESSCVTPDEQYIVLGCNAKILVLDFMTGEIVKEITEELYGNVYDVVVTPDSKYIYAGGGDFLRKFDLENGTFIQEIGDLKEQLEIDNYYIMDMDIKNDGKELGIIFGHSYVTNGESKTKYFLSTYNIEEKKFNKIAEYETMKSVKYSNDGKYLSACFNHGNADMSGTVVLYNTETWQIISLPNSTHSRLVTSVAFSPNNTMLASCGYDGKIKIWDINDLTLLQDQYYYKNDETKYHLGELSFSPDSKYITVGIGREFEQFYSLKIWEIKHWEEIYDYPYIGNTFIYITNDMKYLFISAGKTIFTFLKAHFEPSDIEIPIEIGTLLYPNPTNGIVNISLSVPENTYIEANIIDGTGDNIENIFSSQTVSGVLNLCWDSSDYPSGMYWCRIEGSDFAEVYKFVVVK